MGAEELGVSIITGKPGEKAKEERNATKIERLHEQNPLICTGYKNPSFDAT